METGIEKVFRRIRAIESRFAPQPSAAAEDFSAQLRKEIDRSKPPLQKPRDFTPAAPAAKTAAAPAGSLGEIIEQAARKYGVDPALADAVAKTESDYDPSATSSAGAAGVMQLMPETARALGVRNIYDPRENIDGGVRYLKEMLTAFDGDVTKAVAAYNAGPQAVRNYQGVPPYAETQNYVRKVLDIYR